MAQYFATVDITGLAQHYYGAVVEPPTITRTVGGDARSGFVEYSDIEFELVNPTTAASGSQVSLWGLIRTFLYDAWRNHPIKIEFREATGGIQTTEWYGRITEDELQANGNLRLRGAGFPREILAQRIPTVVITLDDFPYAVDVGKVPPYVLGFVQKMRLLYINDGNGGNYDYMAMLGQPAAGIGQVFRDAINQGANEPSGAQSFEGISPANFVVSVQTATSGYEYTRVRFTERQVNSNGSLVGIYADFEGQRSARNPWEAVKAVLTHSLLCNASADATSFTAAKDLFAALTAPHAVYVDGVIGENGQAVEAQVVLRHLLQIAGGRLGVNASGAFTAAVNHVPPTSITLALGAGPNAQENNLIDPGTRRHGKQGDRAKRYVLDYRPDYQTGTMLFQRIRSVFSTGRDVTDENPFLREHRSADIVASRVAKELLLDDDLVEGTKAAVLPGYLDEGDWFLYTWGGHGCEDDVRLARRVVKDLATVEVDHSPASLHVWGYVPLALPSEYEAPPNNPPGANLLIEDPGPDYIVTAGILVTTAYQTIKSTSITIDTTGNDLKKWAFVEVTTTSFGFQDTVSIRLKNNLTGSNVEVSQQLVADPILFYPYTVYTASFNLSLNEAGVAANTHTVILEIKSNSGGQELFYGSKTVPYPGLMSEAYIHLQEWS